LFVGFSDADVVEGNFTISPKTRVVDTVSIGSSVITVDSTLDVNRMVEVDKVRNLVYLCPLDWNILVVAFANRFKQRAIIPNL
jgi:hypothetical protein